MTQPAPVPAPVPSVAMIPVDAIVLSDTLARRRIDWPDIHALARSIGEHGLLQPILLRPLGDGRYELLAGVRRLLAVRQLRQGAVTARLVSHGAAAVLSLVENTQRENLDALELAEALGHLEEQGRSRKAVAEMVGRSRTWVADVLSLNSLPDAIKAEYPEARKRVSRSLLVEIARERDPERQMVLWREARGGALTVRAARQKRIAARPPLPRALSAVRRCVKQLDRLDEVPDLKAKDRKALLILRERIDALLDGAWEPSPDSPAAYAD